MAIDPKKLKAFMNAPIPMLTPALPADLTEDDREAIQEALEDDMSEESQTMRKLSSFVGYMELNEPAGAFSCGTCRYVTTDGFCGQRDVRAYVSQENGCCNRFVPKDASVKFPPEYKPPRDDMTVPSLIRY